MREYDVYTANGKDFLGEYLTCLLGENKYPVTKSIGETGSSTIMYSMVIVVYINDGIVHQADRTDVQLKPKP